VYLHDNWSADPYDIVKSEIDEQLNGKLHDYVVLSDTGLSLAPGFAKGEKCELYKKEDLETLQNRNTWDNIKGKLEKVMIAHLAIEQFKASEIEEWNKYIEPIVDKARSEQVSGKGLDEKEALRLEMAERLDKLTDRLTHTNDFKEMKAIAKEIKEIKDAMRADDKKEFVRQRGDRDEL
jgi:predicted DNA-binding protein